MGKINICHILQKPRDKGLKQGVLASAFGQLSVPSRYVFKRILFMSGAEVYFASGSCDADLAPHINLGLTLSPFLLHHQEAGDEEDGEMEYRSIALKCIFSFMLCMHLQTLPWCTFYVSQISTLPLLLDSLRQGLSKNNVSIPRIHYAFSSTKIVLQPIFNCDMNFENRH